MASETAVPTTAPALKVLDKSALPHPAAITPAPEGQDGPPSPLSEASSGYFSHSVSTATLSDAPVLSLDAAGPSGQMPGSPAAPGQAPGVELASPLGTHSHPEELPAQSDPHLGLEVPRPLLPPEPPAPASPFRIRKVRTSELKSFTRMLGGSCSGTEEGLLVTVGPSDPGEQAAGKPEVASDSEEASEVPEWLKEGEYVAVGTTKTGIVRYIGPADFQEGTWVGVELDLPSGKNDGSIAGKQYFKCNPGYGLLVRPARVRKAQAAGHRRSTGLRMQGAPEARRTTRLSSSATNLASLTAALAKADRSPKNMENRKSWAS